MKRKLLALLTVLLLLVTMVTPAFADVLWAPRGNSFYESHDCAVHSRSYLANGEKGYVTVRTAPDSLTEVVNLPNGTRFNVVYTWTEKDGTIWGLGYLYGEGEGWIDLSEMAMIYDYISFKEDHGSEFEKYDGSADGLTEACSYSYPGGVYRSKIEGMGGDHDILSDRFDILYTDENGLRWSFVGYFYGDKNFWICIDDPMNENLGTETYLSVDQVRGVPDAELIPAVADVPATGAFPLWAVPVALVIVVAVVTAVIVRKRRKNA